MQYLQSVPPVMTAQISTQIYEQWLSKYSFGAGFGAIIGYLLINLFIKN